ncbi:hypothetical protein EDB85DRAFT_568705 [Lactarius pseudohatsudake]|nr:hypothetical protein EDB85DRAFT_568705 [Lactarius pseudohatsudake]
MNSKEKRTPHIPEVNLINPSIMSESCGNPVSEAGEVLIPRKPKSDTPSICVKCKASTGNLVIRHSVLQVCDLARLLTIFVIEWKLRRGALKPSGSLLVGFSGGLGSTVLLDLVHKIYCAKSESEELKGGKEHPRRNRVWKKIYVCFVHTLRRQIGRRSACSSPRLAHSHGNSGHSIHFDETTAIIHCVLNQRLSPRLGHISHFHVNIARLVDRSRRFCRAADNTGGVDTSICRTRPWRLVMEGRGPLGPGAQRRGHEGMSSLGLVVGANCRWWGSRGFLSLNDHWPLDKRHTRPRVPDLFSAANERPYRIYHWTRERLPFDGIYHRQNCWKTCAQGGIWRTMYLVRIVRSIMEGSDINPLFQRRSLSRGRRVVVVISALQFALFLPHDTHQQE